MYGSKNANDSDNKFMNILSKAYDECCPVRIKINKNNKN